MSASHNHALPSNGNEKTLWLALGLTTLRGWGAQPVSRTRPLSERESVTFSQLELARYEGQRPAEAVACRVGDERFFPSSDAT